MNNNFQTTTATELAVIYNDISVLENHSASHAFHLVVESGILEHIPPFLVREFKRSLVDIILHTGIVIINSIFISY